jgi:tRNA(Leu) C34 or U34 (ribose-2'-O)-methylase TrmL
MRGHFGIGVYQMKNGPNLGTLWRSAYQLGASYIFLIGPRFKKQASDTTKAWRHIPLFIYDTWEQFLEFVPYSTRVVGVEFPGRNLATFVHPERAIYVLGSEDNGLPRHLTGIHERVEIPSVRQPCLNVATAGSIVLYDRLVKL